VGVGGRKAVFQPVTYVIDAKAPVFRDLSVARR
jgi:hypothetical protein